MTGIDHVLPKTLYCTYNTIELYKYGVNMIHGCVVKNLIDRYLFTLIM